MPATVMFSRAQAANRIPQPLAMEGRYPAFPVRQKHVSGHTSHGEISRTLNTRESTVTEQLSSTSRSGNPSAGNHDKEEAAIPGNPSSPILPSRWHASPPPSLYSFIDDYGNEMSEREIANQQEGFGWLGEDTWSDWADLEYDVVDEEDHPSGGRRRYSDTQVFTAEEEPKTSSTTG
ncbi:MAG: hypothetical protein Q9228_008043 [Teloschistes exilis]